jgi:NDP-sugar pyrophosphorylase family protein
MEAILLAGGKSERLGEAAQGRPKALVPVAGRSLAAYQVARLAEAGVDRLLVSCAAGREEQFEDELADLGPEIVTVPEPEPLGRGGGIRLTAAARRESGPIYAQNADDLLDLDPRAVLEAHRAAGAAATIVLAPLPTGFGVVDLDDRDRIVGFREAPKLPYWVNAGFYVLDDEALARLPERGDHEQTTFPELAGEGKLAAYRYDGTWLTVNTPKDLRRADEYLRQHPDWLPAPARHE